ncbi:hypothetical protein BURMUCF1_1907 [Burkholderia multivorans ATCC BAA-247]|nr:hypothetical protein BURMUCF1_1907 [Burkholderia multivorans ATCC BAA-247]
MDTRFQHLAHRDCHVNSPRGLGLKPAAVPAARTRPERSPAPRGRHPGCAGLRFGTCEGARAASLPPRCHSPTIGKSGIWMST